MLRFEIRAKDRLGITVEILEKIYHKSINLISMEVFAERVYLKIEDIDFKTKEALKAEIFTINDVISINEIELLNYEQNEKRLFAVINSVDEGIISIDKNFKINIFNNYCEELFNKRRNEVLGEDIRNIIGKDSPIENLIKKGIEYDSISCSFRNDNDEISYIATGRAIKNDYNETVGAVTSIKDVDKARKLAHLISNIEDGAFKDIIGTSKSIDKVKKMISAVAKSNSTVLLRGESGTGKELFSKAIHSISSRKNKSFVAINCAALPENLLESELFGYEKGSFTGAQQNGKDGLFKEAHEGTLFLDEIGELSMFLQAKLLRVLQEGKIRRIGSNREESIDVRIIASTNKNLEAMIKNGLFREDLYYRLNVIPIYIPRLQERIEDIPMLVNFFIGEYNIKLNKNIKGAQFEFIKGLMDYSWPGNIRELKNIVERAMNLCEEDLLTSKDLIIDFELYNETKTKEIESHYENQHLPLKDIIEQCEKETILKVFESNRSYRKTAKILNVSHTTIMNKIKRYNIIP